MGHFLLEKTGHGIDLNVFEAAGMDQLKKVEIGVHVEGQPVKGDPFSNRDPHEADLSIPHPHPAVSWVSFPFDAAVFQHPDHDLFEPFHEIEDGDAFFLRAKMG
jgi:hypothetical protein